MNGSLELSVREGTLRKGGQATVRLTGIGKYLHGRRTIQGHRQASSRIMIVYTDLQKAYVYEATSPQPSAYAAAPSTFGLIGLGLDARGADGRVVIRRTPRPETSADTDRV